MLPNKIPIAVPKASKQDNRRRHGRIRCDGISCDLGEVIDVSASGIQINTGKTPIPVTSDVAFTIHGPDGAIPVRGTVLRCEKTRKGYEIGLQLHSLSREAARGLAVIARIGATKNEVMGR